MATEIIQTGDPNIVIERTTSDVEINIAELNIEKESIENLIDNVRNRIMQLNQTIISSEFQYLIDEEISKLEIKINEAYAGIALINLILKEI